MKDDGLQSLLVQVTSSSLVDAMGRLHRHRCHILDLVTPTPGRVMFARAATISYFPSCSKALDPERYNFAQPLLRSRGSTKPWAPEPAGKLLVLASNGHPEASLGGGTQNTGAKPGSWRTAGCGTSRSCADIRLPPTAKGRPRGGVAIP